LSQPIAEVVALPVSDAPTEVVPEVAVAEPSPPEAVAPSASAEPVPAPAVDSGDGRGWVRIVAISAAVILVAALVVGVLNSLGTHHQLSSTRRDLAATHSDLSSTTKTLASTKSALKSSSAELAGANQALSETKDQLAGVKQSLADEQSRVNLQAGQISTLRTCLSGIAEGLSREANGDFNGAIAAIDAVQSACDAADKLL
jgi:uncharacterized protein HemX